MSGVHSPTAICSGRLDDDNENEKKRVLITNPETERGSVHSTDQTDKNRPEWLFPRCPANMRYMFGCSRIITEYDEPIKELPHDLEILRKDVYGDGDEEELEFVVRIYTGDSGIKRSLERAYFQRECPHGIIVVVPCNPMIVHMLECHSPSEEECQEMVRKPLDMVLVKLLVEEQQSIDQAMQAMHHHHGHHRHHGH